MTSIMGNSVKNAKSLAQYLLSKNEKPSIPCTALEFATYFIDEGEVEGVRGDIAFFQAMKETGWLKFGNQVLPEQYNYAGLGALNNQSTGKGEWFPTVQVGIRAQIQHLKAYASKDSLNRECVDTRFKYVTRGIAPNWENLNGRWAVPGKGYGEDIISLYNGCPNIINTDNLKEEIDNIDEHIIKINVDSKEYSMNSINYKDNNYIKLREFEKAGYKIDYDAKNKIPSISVVGKVKPIQVLLEDTNIQMNAINIEGSNYIKLKDLELLGYEVGYNANTKTPILTKKD